MLTRYYHSRKINLSLYDPERKYEMEEYGCESTTSMDEARTVVNDAIDNRIAELQGVTRPKKDSKFDIPVSVKESQAEKDSDETSVNTKE